MPPSDDLQSELPVTKEWIQQVLRDRLQLHHDLLSIKSKRIDQGKGYLSYINSVDLHWSAAKNGHSQNGTPPTSVIVKSISGKKFEDTVRTLDAVGDQMMQDPNMLKFISIAHTTECTFYETVRQAKLHFPIPLCFHTQLSTPEQQGLLILENFSDRATTVDIYEGFNLAQAKSVAENIAALHAYSLSTDAWPKLPVFTKDDCKDFLSLLEKMAEQLKADYPEQFTLSMDQLRKLCNIDQWFEGILNPDSTEYTKVLVHGDLWTNNILMEFQPGTRTPSDSVSALIDWQTAHPGNCAEDLCRLLTSSVCAEQRRRHEMEVLQHYYEHLRQLLGKEPPFPFDQLQDLYYKVMQYQSLFLMMQFALMFGAGKPDDPEKIREALRRVNFAGEDAIAHMELSES